MKQISVRMTRMLAMFTFVLTVAANLFGAAVEAPPQSEDFQSGELPHSYWIIYPWWKYVSPWTFSTNGVTGRIEIAGDNTGALTNSIPAGLYQSISGTGANRMRGNCYQCDTTIMLHRQAMVLDRSGAANITFAVYESTSSNGTYTLIGSNTVSAAAGNDEVMSGDMDVTLKSGRYYVIGASWDTSTTYTYTTDRHPSHTALGDTFAGYKSFTYPPPTTADGSQNTVLYPQRLILYTNFVVRMDDSVDAGAYSTNRMDLALKVGGFHNLNLEFRHRDSSDEQQDGDGIFLSVDNGANFTKIYSLSTNADWEDISIDLAAKAELNGLVLSDNTILRFQQTDNYSWPIDGREFDDIKVYSKPDLILTSVSASSPLLWKGFNSTKDIPITLNVQSRAGNTSGTANIDSTFAFDDSGVALMVDTNSTAINYTAMEVRGSTIAHTLQLPASWHLGGIYYNILGEIDSGGVLDEALENNNTNSTTITVNHYSGTLWFDNIETDITVTNWGVRSSAAPATMHWISGTGTLQGASFSFSGLRVIKNTTTLDYSIDPGETAVVNVPFPDRYSVAGVTYWRVSGVELNKDGAYADIKVLLPAGMGISTNQAYVMESTITFEDCSLTQELYPDSKVGLGGPFFMAEETKPLRFDVNEVAWEPTTGRFEFTGADVTATRADGYDKLDSLYGSGDLERASMRTKKDNAAYYNQAASVTDGPVIDTGSSNGDALLSVVMIIKTVSMISHFPYGVEMEWLDDSEVMISEDLFDGSSMLSPADTEIAYSPDCIGPECAGSNGMVNITLKATSHSEFSIDGGLRTKVDIAGGALHWGTRWDNAPAQQTTEFKDGYFYMPGTFIRGDQSVFAATSQLGPAEILLSGLTTNAVPEMERPGTDEYAEGLADYAGLNLRALHDGDYGAFSILGGTESGWWKLTGRSKYYARYSGISGIHEATQGSFPSTLTIYDYPFTFSNFGLSYLSGDVEESRINGSVSVPAPCNFTMQFERLMLCCIGELEDAELANSDTKTLEYWDAVIQPLTLFFAPLSNAKCSDPDRKLCMGLTTHCANVDQTLSGVLGFLADGNLATPATGIEGVPSRLAVPNEIEFDGPGDETYYFNPVAMPYYNDYAKSGSGSSEHGWINFAGNLDVAFFNDLQVHIHTSASTNSSVAPIYMMGGWEDSSKTYFNSDVDEFDTENIGYPSKDSVTYSEYRNPSTDTYRTHATRSWLNVIDLDYPLQWSSSTKSFKSPDAETVKLLVINAEHQTDYLSAENAEISFGIQYDGVPQVNLANMAFNAVDEATGVSSAFSDAVGDAVHDTIEQGLSSMDCALSDLPEELFDPIFEQVLDPMVDDFYDALNAAYSAAPNTAYWGSVVTQYVYGVASPAGDDVDYILKHLANDAGMVSTLAGSVSNTLDDAIAMIDAFISVVSVDVDGNPLPDDLPGILNISDGDYSTLAGLGKGILEVLAESLYDSIKDSIEDELKTVLESAAPSLEAITDVMTELREILVEAQAQTAAAGSLATQLETTLNSVELDSSITKIADGINDWFNELPDGTDFGDYSREEVKAMIRQRITDYFYSSAPCAEVQRIIRSRLYDIDASIQNAIDSVFQQLNKVLRDITSEYLSGIDDSINDALGDISNVMGSGQIDGYAHIKGDTLTELRIDGKFQWKVPKEMDFNAYLIIKQLDSTAAGGCGAAGEELPEVTLGTDGFGIGWMGCDFKADIATKFAFRNDTDGLTLIGMGGSFEMVEGEIGFESFVITKLYAAVAFGELENYISANLKCQFTDYEVEGGAFFGKACSLDPFSWDPDVQSILGDPPFEGIYVYGEAWMPIINYGCVFQIRAGVGAGIFAFTDGRIGGKILIGADGEALCVVSVGGEVVLVGMKEGSNLRMNGTGTISGKVGACPFCVKFSKSVKFTYDNGDWGVDY